MSYKRSRPETWAYFKMGNISDSSEKSFAHCSFSKQLEGCPLGQASEEFALLDTLATIDDGTISSGHEQQNAPLLTRGAYDACEKKTPQYGLLGQTILQCSGKDLLKPKDGRIYFNTDAPSCTVLCGVQGSGKSHSVSVLVESMIIKDSRIGKMHAPICTLVFHYDSASSSCQPCEIAHLGVRVGAVEAPPVVVLASPSSLNTMTNLYAKLGANITVVPFYISMNDVTVSTIMSLMKIDTDGAIPLNFTWNGFEREILKIDLNPAQKQMLEQRMNLLTSFLFEKSKFARRQKVNPSQGVYVPGTIVIVDLTDPFLDSDLACSLFEIVLDDFVKSPGKGKAVVMDEAHKYLSQEAQSGSSRLCKSLIRLTRLQRHCGMRLIISSQEPTAIPNEMIDLCNVMIVHRFSSPSWWAHLAHHISCAKDQMETLFDKVLRLKTGYALVFSPSALVILDHELAVPTVSKMGRGYFMVKIRKRVSHDGGVSVMSV